MRAGEAGVLRAAMDGILLSEHTLFRKEVLQSQRGSALGSILIAAPPSRWLMATLSSALSAAVVVMLVFGHYTRRETVSGQLVPDDGLLALTSPSAGIVTQLRVHDGQSVQKGDVLLELTTDQDSAVLGKTHAAVSSALNAQRTRLLADLVNQSAISKQQEDALRNKVTLLHSQVIEVEGQLALQHQQVASNQNLLDRIRPLESKGYVSVFQIQQQQQALLDAQAQFKSLMRQQLDVRQQLDTAKQQLMQLPLDDESKRNDTERQLANVTQSLAQNEMGRAIVLRAPSDGIVSAVLLKAGQTATAGQSVVSILPAGATLQAQLLLPSRAAGFLAVGKQVALRYQAFPYQKFGQQYGHVIDVSRSALSPAEVSAITGQQTQEPMYRVMVALDRQEVMAYGKPEAIKPGMALEADILLERRRLIEWVFEPLYGLGHHLQGVAAPTAFRSSVNSSPARISSFPIVLDRMISRARLTLARAGGI